MGMPALFSGRLVLVCVLGWCSKFPQGRGTFDAHFSRASRPTVQCGCSLLAVFPSTQPHIPHGARLVTIMSCEDLMHFDLPACNERSRLCIT